ncbi:MAG: Na+/H+ antiporter subunit G [Azoarcus sp.]|nr:Na+/H+ antiporter subunit G [Azoarcus sp.]
MNLFVEFVVSALIVIGGVFLLVGSLGMIKLPELMARLHAPTKATTLGIGSALFASVVFFSVTGDFSIHEVLIVFFLFLTAPITAHFVAKAYMHEHRDRVGELPATGSGCGWSTFDRPPGGHPDDEADPADERG